MPITEQAHERQLQLGSLVQDNSGLQDAENIRRARQGDQTAWLHLVRAHQEPVFRLAYLFLGEVAEAEDIAQEAFLRAYRNLDRYDAERPLRPWLLSIAANLARNRRRSIGRYWAALKRFFQSEPPQGDSLEELSHQREEASLLWEAIQKLGEADQEVIYLRYYLEMPVEAAAEVMQVAPGTIKSRLHRALKRLQIEIEANYPGLIEISHG